MSEPKPYRFVTNSHMTIPNLYNFQFYIGFSGYTTIFWSKWLCKLLGYTLFAFEGSWATASRLLWLFANTMQNNCLLEYTVHRNRAIISNVGANKQIISN